MLYVRNSGINSINCRIRKFLNFCNAFLKIELTCVAVSFYDDCIVDNKYNFFFKQKSNAKNAS